MLGAEGRYQNGRPIGQWKECDRFDRCTKTTYDILNLREQARVGVHPQLPVLYSAGRYRFDFASCWSSVVYGETPESLLELTFGGDLRCIVVYSPKTVGTMRSVREGEYTCGIPYSVGVREFESLDLIAELPKAGLPQFCWRPEPLRMQTPRDGNQIVAFAIWVGRGFVDARTNTSRLSWGLLANVVDVECASMTTQPGGRRELTVRLNRYVENLVIDRAGRDATKANTCGGQFPLSQLSMTRDAAGRALFTYALSEMPATAERQRACIAAQIELKPSCASR